LSLALAINEMLLLRIDPLPGASKLTVGGAVSGHSGVVAEIKVVCGDSLLALSTADTEKEYVLKAARPESEEDVAGAKTCLRNIPLR
jgi:hypothetical protein